MTQLDTTVFIAKFVEEARDRLTALGATLLRLEQSPVAGDALAEAMRDAHSIKGSALMLGLSDISKVSHQLEDLFVAARRHPELLDRGAFDVAFAAVDLLSIRIEQLATGMLDPIETSEVCEKLAGLLGDARKGQGVRVEDSRIPVPSAPRPLPLTPDLVPAPVRRVPEMLQSLRVPIEKLDRLTHLAPEMVVQSLKAFERHAELRRLERVLSRLRDRVREARLLPAGTEADRGVQLGEYADALDSLTRRMRDFLVTFSDDRVRLTLITEELRQNVIELTMLPIASVFDAFSRAVRDLARNVDKEVELVIRGRETELDKKIIEQIAEPLTHLIRNAVDHGIESSADREHAGKPAAGQLVLSAEQQGNRILIALRDDGRGIDPEVIRSAAILRGVAPAHELAEWTAAQLFDLIFQPGFSTRSATTDVSGRGVGLDVVKTVVERLGGAVRVQSELLRGTTITLNLPLSLALLRVVLLEAGDDLFALPTAAVRRILHIGAAEVVQLQQGPVADIGGEAIPLSTLAALLRVPSGPAAQRQTVVVAESGENRFGLIVDAVHEEQELVFKELKGPLRNQRTFTGAALLGNGDIVPILDVGALFELASIAPSMASAPAVERRPAARQIRVLVVDDSLVAGELQKNILVAAGYEAEIAHDGLEGFELLRQSDWDLVIADVDMPRMTGFELTAKLRADQRLHDIPVIIVTGRDAADDRRRGFEVGADAYVLKREFDQSHLLETVRRLVGRGAEAANRGTYA